MIERAGSKSILFFMEQIIALLIFAVCVTACVSIFVEAHETADETYDLNNALVAAKNGAECFKATGGDMSRTAAILDGEYVDPEINVYFNSKWETCRSQDAVYVLRIRNDKPEDDPYPVIGELSVQKMSGDEILAFTVAAGRVSVE